MNIIRSQENIMQPLIIQTPSTGLGMMEVTLFRKGVLRPMSFKVETVEQENLHEGCILLVQIYGTIRHMMMKLIEVIKYWQGRAILEEVSKHVDEDFESKQHPNDNERKYLQSNNKETEPVENDIPAEIIVSENIAPVETISDEKYDIEMQRLLRIMLCFSILGY